MIGAVAAGRLGTAVLAVLLPLLVLPLVRALGAGRPAGEPGARPGRPACCSRSCGLRAAGLGVARCSCWRSPRPRRPRPARVAARLAVVAVVPPVLLLPWLPALVADPQLLLLEAGLPGPGLTDAGPATAWRCSCCTPAGPGCRRWC